MINELSRVERAALHKMQQHGGVIRVDESNPQQRGLHWLLDNLAQRGYVVVVQRSGPITSYQLQPGAVALAEREPRGSALMREYSLRR